MKSINKLKTYILAPSKCFVPKCQARCCIDAPLPEDFLQKFRGRIQRPIYSAVNIGVNDPKDTFNSVVYNTTPNPIQLVGRDQDGHKLFGIPQEIFDKLQIKSMEQISELMEKYKNYPNYCPFITEYARCSVYEHRPFICREFGSSPLKVDYCPDKSSRWDIFKFAVKRFFDVKGTFLGVKAALKEKFSKS